MQVLVVSEAPNVKSSKLLKAFASRSSNSREGNDDRKTFLASALWCTALYYECGKCVSFNVSMHHCDNRSKIIQITMTRLPHYEIVVVIANYTNPSRSARGQTSNTCRGSNCSCCDGSRDGSGNCSDGCDSSFVYCLREVDTLDGHGCPYGGTILISHPNYDDRPTDFSQNTVLGLDNPLVFQGLSDTWKVSIIPYRTSCPALNNIAKINTVFSLSQQGVQLYVRIWDIDGHPLELIDEVKWNITQGVGADSGEVSLTGMYEIVTMKVNTTVLCVPGFTGTMCEENIDDCVGVSCGENRQCVDGV